MTVSQSFIRRKRSTPLITVRPKVFIKKVNLNLIMSKIIKSSFSGNANDLMVFPNNNVKVCFYKLLKVLKNSKRHMFNLGDLGWKFQLSGFYTSFIETEKKIKILVLKEKIRKIRSSGVITVFFRKPSIVLGSMKKKKRNLSSLAKGVYKFEDLYSDYFVIGAERQIFFRTLKARRFFPSLFFSRLFLYAAKGRKKYGNIFFYVFKRKRKIDSLFHLYTLSSLKFKDVRKQRRKFYKKMAWKIRKQKKWRRRVRVSFVLFRLRQKLSQIFYVPKHFEINYKTFAANYLGYTDAKTTNTKIAFWLNLRKLLTFLT